ncbi:hypothetical protein J7K70_00140 [bacterium]|nr:hypothetical protein [bacterium]
MDKKLLDQEIEKVEKEIEDEEIIKRNREHLKRIYPPLSRQELLEILGLTIKRDEANKIITFLCFLSAYTENSQFNISFNAPSSTGKSYIPIEIASLFPKEDVIKVGYCSPTAFFHEKGEFQKELGGYYLDLERKVLIFLDQPHTQLLEHLRPLLSHDEKEIKVKITDKSQKHGLKTKNVVIRGYPSVIFCSAGLKIDEQEATRFLLLSPEITQEKIREGVLEALKKAANLKEYLDKINNNPKRQLLVERIKAIKEEGIEEIKIHDIDKIREKFFSAHKTLQPRHQRDIKRLISLIKSLALLNLWHRQTEELKVILTSDKDIEEGFRLWEEISFSQELNLPPYIFKVFEEIISPLYEEKQEGLTRKEIMRGYLRIYNRPIAEWQLRREIIPMLEMAGLIVQEQDPDDKRNKLIIPVYPTPQSTISKPENNVDWTVG